jgi:hypothetical protein
MNTVNANTPQTPHHIVIAYPFAPKKFRGQDGLSSRVTVSTNVYLKKIRRRSRPTIMTKKKKGHWLEQ